MDNIARLSRECFFETMIKCNFIPKSVIYYTCCSLYVHKNVYSLFLFLTVTLFFQVKINLHETIIFRRKERKRKRRNSPPKKSNENKGKHTPPSDRVKRIVHKNTTTNSYVIGVVEQSGAESAK